MRESDKDTYSRERSTLRARDMRKRVEVDVTDTGDNEGSDILESCISSIALKQANGQKDRRRQPGK